MNSLKWSVVFAILIENILCVRCEQTKSFNIVTRIQNRFAETTISSEILNDESVANEIGFHVMLPKEAFITYFDMTINGTKYEGEIEEKKKAEKIFGKAKERGKTVGIVRSVKQTNKVFKTSVNIATNQTVAFTLIYQQLLRKVNGKFRNTIVLLGSSLDPTVTPEIDVFICESRKLTNVAVPETSSSDKGVYEHDVAIDHKGGNWAHIEFLNIKIESGEDGPAVDEYDSYGNSPNASFWSNYTGYTGYAGYASDSDADSSTGSGSFIVEYELEDAKQGGEIIVHEGYLIHFFAPEIDRPPRRVVFVLDISGSMIGRKLEQMTDAMMNILNKVSDLDKIGLIKFTSGNHVWQKGNLSFATPDQIESAKNFLRYPHSNAGTYIWSALKEALNMLIKDVRDEKVDPENNMIILLTDGLGTLSKSEVLANVKGLGKTRFAIHTIGFGDGVDADLLKGLAAKNHGTWKQILEGFDAQLQIENYIDELGIALLSGIQFEYPDIVEETVQAKDKYLYGSEVIAMSKLKKDIDFSKREPHFAKVKGFSPVEIVIEAQFYLEEKVGQCDSPQYQTIRDFGKKAFGMIKVEETLRQYDAEDNSTEKEKLKERAIEMSLLYKLVTSVTSMLVVTPEDKAELEKEIALEELLGPTDPPPPVYGSGGGGWHRQAPGYSGYGDPHFVVKLSNDINVCFNWRLRGHRVVNLLYDEENQIVVNALMMSGTNEEDEEATAKHGLFIREAVIILARDDIEIAIEEDMALVIDMNDDRKQDGVYLPLNIPAGSYNATYGNIRFAVTGVNDFHTLMHITINENINIEVKIHRYNPKKNFSRSHLDLLVADSEGLSDNVRGFFGTLHVQKEMQKLSIRIEENKNEKQKMMTHLLVFKGRKVPVRREEKHLPHTNGTFDCWWTNNVDKLLGLPLETFDEKSLFEIPL